MGKDILRKLTEIETRLGFVYIPAKGLDLFPAKNMRISVKLEGEAKKRKLRFNVERRRVFGLTSWYKKRLVQPKDEIRISKLGGRLNYEIRLRRSSPEEPEREAEKLLEISGLSSMTKGDIVEDRIKELILLHGQGLLNVYKPVVDLEGIDMAVVKSGVFQPLFLQIKGRFKLQKGGGFLIDIRKKTFTSHHTYYVAGAYFNPERLEIHDYILLIPSTEVEKAKISGKAPFERYRITTALNPKSKSKWAKYIVEKTELADKLLEKLEEMEKYLK
jgi:hypothetical protein